MFGQPSLNKINSDPEPDHRKRFTKQGITNSGTRTLDAPWNEDEKNPTPIVEEEKKPEISSKIVPAKRIKKHKYPGDPGYKPTPSYESGWEHFSPACNTVESMNCRVCNRKMRCKRAVNGPTSSAEARTNGKHLHDTFKCDHAQKDWHVQALVLKKQAEKTPSAVLEKLLLEEAEQIIKTKKATKKVHKLFS